MIVGLKQGLDAIMSATLLSQGSDAVISGKYTFYPLRMGVTARPLDATDPTIVPPSNLTHQSIQRMGGPPPFRTSCSCILSAWINMSYVFCHRRKTTIRRTR